MNKKLPILSNNFTEKADSWDETAKLLQKTAPLKTLRTLPIMAGITSKTRRFLKLKALLYMIFNDEEKLFPLYFFKHPWKYTLSLLKSYFRNYSFTQEEDLFYYGLKNKEEFKNLAQTSILLVGFSYCHKPFECPSGRFSSSCANILDHPVCGQCFIGKCKTLSQSKQCELFPISTVHDIGKRLFELRHLHPTSSILFLITSCELSLTMFADFGNMIDAKGIGVSLKGRICNTMKAFKLSEKGVKPGLTLLLDHSQKTILELLQVFPSRNGTTYETALDVHFDHKDEACPPQGK